MTKEEFAALQRNHVQSGMSLKLYLRHIGTSYSTYNYWRRKYRQEEPTRDFAPITLKQSPTGASSLAGLLHGGATLLFPNGLRAHLGSDMEDLLKELLNKSLPGNVLP